VYLDVVTFVCFLGYKNDSSQFGIMKVGLAGNLRPVSPGEGVPMNKSTIQASELGGVQALGWIPHARLELLSRRMTELRVEKGEVLYRPGQPAKDVYCVLEGAVGLCLLGSNARILRLSVAVSGEFFGVSALTPGWRRVSRAIELRESRVGRIEARTFGSAVCGRPW
jgi:hypothetical protein